MSARMDATVECACDEMESLQTIELLARGLLADPRNKVITGHRITLEHHLTRLDTLRAINQAKEPA
jgi:hypothetical protein